MMERSTNLFCEENAFLDESLEKRGRIHSLHVKGLPAPHPAEADTFTRQQSVPGHRQDKLSTARVVLVGAGGLNSWVAVALLRSGLRSLTVIDPDYVERTNLPRQLYGGKDLGAFKTERLIENLAAHALEESNLYGIALPFEDAVERFALPMDLLVAGVDRNDCRLFASRLGRTRGIPVIFTMLSRDGMRCQVFLQGPSQEDACLWCALPNLDPERAMPCASAIITSCLMAAGFTGFFAHRALMGWPNAELLYNWREADLSGIAQDRTGYVKRRSDCAICGQQDHNRTDGPQVPG